MEERNKPSTKRRKLGREVVGKTHGDEVGGVVPGEGRGRDVGAEEGAEVGGVEGDGGGAAGLLREEGADVELGGEGDDGAADARGGGGADLGVDVGGVAEREGGEDDDDLARRVAARGALERAERGAEAVLERRLAVAAARGGLAQLREAARGAAPERRDDARLRVAQHAEAHLRDAAAALVAVAPHKRLARAHRRRQPRRRQVPRARRAPHRPPQVQHQHQAPVQSSLHRHRRWVSF